MKRILALFALFALSALPASAQVFPAIGNAANITNISSIGNTVVKAGPGIFYGVEAESATVQTAALQCFDNATTNSGTVVLGPTTLAANATVLKPAGGVAVVNGITCNLSAAAVGVVQIMWR